MERWIITWDIGYGARSEVIDAVDEESAQKLAYEAARQDFEDCADYSAEPYTKERADELGAE